MIKTRVCFPFWSATLATLAVTGSAQAQSTRQDPLPQVYTLTPTEVNLQTGKFRPAFTDFAIGPISLVRGGPQSRFEDTGGLGLTLGMGLLITYPNQPTMTVIVDGASYTYINGSVGWQPWSTNSVGSDLTVAGGKYRLVGRGGQVYQFTPHPAYSSDQQVLDYVEYTDGSRLTYSYNSDGNIRQITSNRGYAVILEYSANHQATAACGFNLGTTYVDASTSCASSNLKMTYGWTTLASGTLGLQSMTDQAGNVVSITYTSSSLPECITLPNSSTCRVTSYYGDQPGDASSHTRAYQVRKQMMADGSIWLFDYDNNYDHEIPLQPGEIRYSYAYMSDPMGRETSMRYANGLADTLWEPGNRTSTYKFSGFDPTQFTLPEGNVVDLLRDGRGNLVKKTVKAKTGSTDADIVSTADYPTNRYGASGYAIGCNAASQKLCDKPNFTVDANSNRTDYTYDASHGGVLTETGPAVNGIRPQTRYRYEQRSAWIMTSSSTYVQAATPVWVRTRAAYCKTGAASGDGCAVAGDEVVTSYDYGPDNGPNNLLLRGTVVTADGTSLRTCTTYDWRGNKLSESKPGAGLASCN